MTRVRARMGRVGGPAAAAVAAVLMTAIVGGCTSDNDPGVASAGSTPTGPTATGADLHAQELEFVACMRSEGIADMPDPVPGDTSGRSAVRYALDVMGKGSDPLFQAALDECRDLLPELPAEEPPSSEELAGLLEFARCMRDNGLADFPDPGPQTQIIFLDGPGHESVPAVTVIDEDRVGVNVGDPAAALAWENCRPLFPYRGGE